MNERQKTEHVIHQIFLPSSKNRNWRVLLPELTQSDPVNVQLYALIGLLLKQFVQSWHSLITNDKTFLHEILETLANITHKIENRLTLLDFNEIIMNELPMLIQSHVEDIRTARERVDTGVMPIEDIEKAFHSLRPHPALDTKESEQLFRKVLAKGLMVVLIDENIKSAAARTLLMSILNEIVLKTAVDRLSEPWMIYEILIKVLNMVPEKHPDPLIDDWYKKGLKFCGEAVTMAGKVLAYFASLSESSSGTPPAMTFVFNLIGTLLKLNPLLVSTLKTLSIPFRTGKLAKLSTKMVNRMLRQYICNEKTIVAILKSARENLFPNNGSMGPPRVLPDEDEQCEIRERLKKLIAKQKLPIDIDELLDLFGNKQINKHLVYNLIDYIVVTLLPELVDKPPVEIQIERLKV